MPIQTFQFLSFDVNTNGYSLSDYLANYGGLPVYSDRYGGAYTVTQTYSTSGYYNFTFTDPVFFPMRTVVNIKFTSGSIAIDSNGFFGVYSEVEWDRATYANRIISTYYSIFYFNVITNRPKLGYSSQHLPFRRRFPIPGDLMVYSSFFCDSEVSFSINIQVVEGEIFFESMKQKCTIRIFYILYFYKIIPLHHCAPLEFTR